MVMDAAYFGGDDIDFKVATPGERGNEFFDVDFGAPQGRGGIAIGDIEDPLPGLFQITERLDEAPGEAAHGEFLLEQGVPARPGRIVMELGIGDDGLDFFGEGFEGADGDMGGNRLGIAAQPPFRADHEEAVGEVVGDFDVRAAPRLHRVDRQRAGLQHGALGVLVDHAPERDIGRDLAQGGADGAEQMKADVRTAAGDSLGDVLGRLDIRHVGRAEENHRRLPDLFGEGFFCGLHFFAHEG